MAGAGTTERLRGYLRELPPRARALLTDQFERAIVSGNETPGADLIVKELRGIAREQREGVTPLNEAARLFFRPLEPFLVDDCTGHRHQYRLARASLEPLWIWVRRDLVPEQAAAFAAHIGDPHFACREQYVSEAVNALHDCVIDAAEAAFAAAAEDDAAKRRLHAQIGTPRPQEDAAILLDVLKGRERLSMFSRDLPLQIPDLDATELARYAAPIDEVRREEPHLLAYMLLMVMQRLRSPWQAIRFGSRFAGSAVAARVAQTPYSITMTMLLAEMERLVCELNDDLLSGARGVRALLKYIHDFAHGLRSELDLPVSSSWARAASAQRAFVGDLLQSQAEGALARLRGLFNAGEGSPFAAVNPAALDDSATAIEFVCTSCDYAGEFGVQEALARILAQMRHYLDAATRELIEASRWSAGSEAVLIEARLGAAQRLGALLFDPAHAAELREAAELAHVPEAIAA